MLFHFQLFSFTQIFALLQPIHPFISTSTYTFSFLFLNMCFIIFFSSGFFFLLFRRFYFEKKKGRIITKRKIKTGKIKKRDEKNSCQIFYMFYAVLHNLSKINFFFHFLLLLLLEISLFGVFPSLFCFVSSEFELFSQKTTCVAIQTFVPIDFSNSSLESKRYDIYEWTIERFKPIFSFWTKK